MVVELLLSGCQVDVKWMSSGWGVDGEWTLILTRGCFALVIRNKVESNPTHCCSVIQYILTQGCFGLVIWNNSESDLTRPCSI